MPGQAVPSTPSADENNSLFNAYGLLGEEMPGGVQFEYDEGILYLNGVYVGDYGTYSSYSLRPVVLNAAGGVYTTFYQYWLGGGYVADGIIALVDIGSYTGVEAGGIGVGAWSADDEYAGWWDKFGYILLVDPAVYSNGAAAHNAAKKLFAGQTATLKNAGVTGKRVKLARAQVSTRTIALPVNATKPAASVQNAQTRDVRNSKGVAAARTLSK